MHKTDTLKWRMAPDTPNNNRAANISPIRLEWHDRELCVEASWMIEVGMFSKSNYKWMKREKKLIVLRRGCRNTPALVAYESLPQRYKDAIRQMVGDPYRKARRSNFADGIQPDPDAAEFYSTYKLADGRNLPAKTQSEYRTNAEVLNAVLALAKSRTAFRRKLGGKTGGIWPQISNLVNRLDTDYYPHTLPANARRFRQRAEEYGNGGYAALISGKYGNNNSRKVTADLESLIISLYCLPTKPYASSVHEMYLQFLGGALEVCHIKGDKKGLLFERADFYDKKGQPIIVTDTTVWNYLNDPKNRIIVDRYRSEAMQFNGKHRPHHDRKAPVYAMSKVSMDDRDISHATTRADGKKVKAYYMYDVMSTALIGASHSIKKDADLFIDCFRDMLRFLRRNNIGMPLEVEVENHLTKSFEKGLLKADGVFDFVRFCNPGNSQEKWAETGIRMKKYGAEKSAQKNIGRHYAKLEANRTNRKKIFDENNDNYEEGKAMSVERIIADDLASVRDYNNQLHPNQKLYPNKTRMEVFKGNLNPGLAKFDESYIMQYVGEHTETSIRRTQYCRVQYENYWLPDPEIIARLEPNNYSVDAYYLPEEDGTIQKVYIYQNGEFICECAKVDKYSTAKAEWGDADPDAYLEQAKYVSKFDKMERDSRDKVEVVEVIRKQRLAPTPDEMKTDVLPPFAVEEAIDYEKLAESFRKDPTAGI